MQNFIFIKILYKCIEKRINERFCLNFTDSVTNMLSMRSAELRIAENAVARKLIAKVGHMERMEMYRTSGASYHSGTQF